MNQKNNQRTRIIVLIALFVLIGAGCDLLPGSDNEPVTAPITIGEQDEARVISEGNIVPREYKYLSFIQPGQVAEILVEKGQAVSQGQILARLKDSEQAEAALALAEYETLAAEQALDDLNEKAELAAAAAWQILLDAREIRINAERVWQEIDTEDYQDDIDDAIDDVLDLEDDLEEAKKDFDPYKDLDEDNASRKRYEEDLEEAQLDYDEAVQDRDELINMREQAEAALEQARAAEIQALDDYETTRGGPDPDKLALADARLRSAVTQITAAHKGLEKLELTAPFAGSVVDIDIIENQQISPNVWAFLIADYSQLYVETNDLTELEVVKISEGQAVLLAPDALPSLELNGLVEEISDHFRLQSGDILFDVRILLLDADPRLRWGMTVEVTFINGE